MVNNVQKEETLVAINFVMLDCSLLKISIVDHCDVWQSNFTTLLYNMTCAQLKVIPCWHHCVSATFVTQYSLGF